MRESSGHYERAFDQLLRERRASYVSIDEARRLLIPPRHAPPRAHTLHESPPPLKYFDYVVYTPRTNLLVELKGRRLGSVVRGSAPDEHASGAVRASSRLECWVTRDDATSMLRWQGLFGPGFEALIVFVYECMCEPPDALFQDTIAKDDRWYTFRAVRVSEYAREMKVRSPRWGTVDLAPSIYEQISHPFTALAQLPTKPSPPPGAPHPPCLDADAILAAAGVPSPR